MKLLELHIRNIASIEKADIDFENDEGLKDPETGMPAQKFLIFGDTGTGKSVLLDAIAMALYKKTPRIAELENSRQNKYHTREGQEVSIAHIEQYTRLGISEKEECYSEVVFTTAHDVVCRARLELGYTKGRTGLKYRKKWLFKEGSGEWTEIKSDRETMIGELIGLTFSQFNRMAMLAQGQFAEFLCGDRNQRSDILEKLTNTEIFSRYGEAISNIYKRKTTAAIESKKVMETASAYVQMSDTEMEMAEKLIASDKEREQQLEEERKRLSATIETVKKTETAMRDAVEAEKRLMESEKEMEEEEYKMQVSACKDWDETDKERKAVESLGKNRTTMENARKELSALAPRFAELSAALRREERREKETEQALNEEEKWLAEQSGREELYKEAGRVTEKLKNYKKAVGDIERLKEARKKATDNDEALHKALAEAKKAKKEADEKDKEIETSIETLTKQRDELNPKELGEQMKRTQKLILALEKLHDDYATLSQKKEDVKRLEGETEKLRKEEEEAEEEQKRCKERYDSDFGRYDMAKARLTTIKSSLDDTLSDLRKKMAEEKTEICPLCGQKIGTELLSNEQFANIISPFDEEEKRAKKALDDSSARLTEADKKVSGLKAQIKEKENAIEKTKSEIETMTSNITPRMVKAGIEMADTAGERFEKKKEAARGELESLEQKSKQCDRIQKEIDAKLGEQKQSSARSKEALQAYQKAVGTVERNNDTINQLAAQIAKTEGERDTTGEELHKSLDVWCEAWGDAIEETATRLKNEAEEYIGRQKEHDKGRNALKSSRERTESMMATRERIMANIPEWGNVESETQDAESEGLASASPDDWNTLADSSISLTTTMKNCAEEIGECTKMLEEWALTTGNSIEKLERLSKMGDSIPAFRKHIADTEGNRKIWSERLAEARKATQQGREALRLEADTPLPHLTELQEREKELQEQATAIHDGITKARQEIDNNLKNIELKKKSEQQYAVAEKEKTHWEALNKTFGGNRFRNLVQTHILRPLLQNANIYLHQISERYTLTCDEENEQLSIFVMDGYNRDEMRSVAVLSGGERFMISLSLALALSSLNRPEMNMNILFIDEGFGTLDQEYLDSVMKTLGHLSEMAHQSNRRVGIISHREELLGCIPNKIKLKRIGEGRSQVEVVREL